MFTHIRRHQKWLWIFISGAVIISFVWYFNPNQQYGGGAGVADDGIVGTIYGEPISRKTYSDAYREAVIQYLFSYGEWPRDSEMARQLGLSLERETRNRLLLLHKLEDYQIEVSDKATADWIVQAFQDRETKTYQPEVYERFIAQLPQQNLRRADFERYARHQVGIQHLAALAGTPGKLITPREAAFEYRLQNQKVDAKVVLLNSSNFVAQVPMTPEAISQFYTNRASAYREPEKVQISYVAFPISNYVAVAREKLAGETNLNERIEMLYAQRGANFYTDENNQVMTPEAAKAKIREEAEQEMAELEARRDATTFALALEEQIETNPPSPDSANPAENLEKIAAEKSLQVQTTPPFSQFQGPAGMTVPAQFSRLAFQLSPEEPVLLQPIVGESAVYVVSFRKRIPSRLQPFEEVQPRVTEEYRRVESYRLAREAGNAFAEAASKAVAAGGTFESAAQEAGLQVIDLQPFSRDARFIEGLPPQIDASSVTAAAFETAPGQVSEFANTREGGVVVYVEKVIPVEDEEVERELPTFLTELRRRSASRAFDDWFRNEMELARLTLAGDEEAAGRQSSL